MRLIATFLSVLVLLYLTYTFVVEEKSNQKPEQAFKTPILIEPAYISSTPLEVERVWQQLKADRLKSKQPVQDKTDEILKSKDVFAIGDSKYTLYGIFNGGEYSKSDVNTKYSHENIASPASQAFILIKALVKTDNSEEVQMLKIAQGEELSKGVTLVTVTSNSISFSKNDELIEFKLFEARNNRRK